MDQAQHKAIIKTKLKVFFFGRECLHTDLSTKSITMTEKDNQTESIYAKHAASDPALAPKTMESEEIEKKKGMTLAGKWQVDHLDLQE